MPTLNEADHLSATLRRLHQHRERSGQQTVAGAVAATDSYEVIVVDGGSTDGTQDIARRLGARLISCTRGRARQMNEGARHARGQSLYFLHADSLPPVDWLRQLREHGPLPCCFRLRFAGQEGMPLLRLYAAFTRLDVQAFRFGDQSLWVRREDFEAIGGYAADWRLLEDNELIRRLRRHCGGFRILAGSVTTSPRKYLRFGFVRTQLVYVLLYTLYRLGASQDVLTAVYARLLRT
ncbi:TIGR04283 family arsenosugar biosynthesis glycosyltransferase [Neolewinella maritima]|uniref:TIGR04283 family arsenosugar biosynthesis glycosyltransferase n=1 Tax=Neolewinella maritima TaxID=1383882 RepID=UPI001EE8398F|nr:TIGR04283 family arsenosugar biosynthesis glycosyltransferase [Neolewinella maritima]